MQINALYVLHGAFPPHARLFQDKYASNPILMLVHYTMAGRSQGHPATISGLKPQEPELREPAYSIEPIKP